MSKSNKFKETIESTKENLSLQKYKIIQTMDNAGINEAIFYIKNLNCMQILKL